MRKNDFLAEIATSVDSAKTGMERSSVQSLQFAGVRASHVRCTQAHAHEALAA